MSAPRGAGPARSARALLGVAAACLLLLMVLGGIKSVRDLRAARAREAELTGMIREAESRIRFLARRIEDLRSDPATLERVAREEFLMLRPEEVVVVLPEAPPPEPAAAEDSGRS